MVSQKVTITTTDTFVFHKGVSIEHIGIVCVENNIQDIISINDALAEEAIKLGANAILGLKYGFDSFGKIISAYGTAVKTTDNSKKNLVDADEFNGKPVGYGVDHD